MVQSLTLDRLYWMTHRTLERSIVCNWVWISVSLFFSRYMVRIPIHTGPGRVSQAFSGPQVHAGVMCSGGACPDRLCSTLRGVKIVFQAHMSGVSVFVSGAEDLEGFRAEIFQW